MISMLWYMWLNESIIYILKVEKVDLLPGSVFGGYSNNSRSHASLTLFQENKPKEKQIIFVNFEDSSSLVQKINDIRYCADSLMQFI